MITDIIKKIIAKITDFYWKFPALTIFLFGVLTGLLLSFIF
jgi:hypothetical protein